MANLYQNPVFQNNSAPALNATNMNNLANCAEANQSYSIPVTIPSSGWSSGSITLTATGVTSTTEGEITLAQSATDAQALAASRALFRVTAQAANSITIKAMGMVPSTQIPAVIKVHSSGSMNSGTITAAFPALRDYIATTVTLSASNWSNKSQTVSVSGVTSSSLVDVTFAPASAVDYVDAFVVCTAQGNGTLTFTCQTTPSNNISVNVVIRG